MKRKGLPEAFRCMKCSKGKLFCYITANLQNLLYYSGEVKSVMTSDNQVRCLKWHDKREVNMLSTYHSDDVIEKSRRSRNVGGGVETIKKPRMIEDYNNNINGVDLNDQNIKYYDFPHRYQ